MGVPPCHPDAVTPALLPQQPSAGNQALAPQTWACLAPFPGLSGLGVAGGSPRRPRPGRVDGDGPRAVGCPHLGLSDFGRSPSWGARPFSAGGPRWTFSPRVIPAWWPRGVAAASRLLAAGNGQLLALSRGMFWDRAPAPPRRPRRPLPRQVPRGAAVADTASPPVGRLLRKEGLSSFVPSRARAFIPSSTHPAVRPSVALLDVWIPAVVRGL